MSTSEAIMEVMRDLAALEDAKIHDVTVLPQLLRIRFVPCRCPLCATIQHNVSQ